MKGSKMVIDKEWRDKVFDVLPWAQFITQDMDGTDENDDYTSVYAGVKYKFNNYVILYTEIGQEDGDLASYGSATSFSSKDNDNTVGMYLNFQY